MLHLWDEFANAPTADAQLRRAVRLSTPVGIGRFYLNRQPAQYLAIAPDVVIEASIKKGGAGPVASRSRRCLFALSARHALILKSGENFPQATRLFYKGIRRPVHWGHVIFHHDRLNIKDAALRGYGIAPDIPPGMVLDALRLGRLVPVLNGWRRDDWAYSIVTRDLDGPHTHIGRFARRDAQRATQETNDRRGEGFRILGINPDLL